MPVGFQATAHVAQRASSLQAINLSASGMLVAGDLNVMQHQLVSVEFRLAGVEFSIVARVARLADQSRLGLQFSNLSRQQRLTLVRFVATHRAESEATALLTGAGATSPIMAQVLV